MAYDFGDITGQENISETVITNNAGLYGIPVTGLKQIDSYLDRALYFVDITDMATSDTITTKVPMNHYQIIKCALMIMYPDEKKETLFFEYNNDTELIFRLGSIKEKEYKYIIACFKAVDTRTFMSFKKTGEFFDRIPDTSNVRPTVPYKIIAITTNKNLVQN